MISKLVLFYILLGVLALAVAVFSSWWFYDFATSLSSSSCKTVTGIKKCYQFTESLLPCSSNTTDVSLPWDGRCETLIKCQNSQLSFPKTLSCDVFTAPIIISLVLVGATGLISLITIMFIFYRIFCRRLKEEVKQSNYQEDDKL